MVGKLIVLEGVEGCGKTTQLQKLQPWLQQDSRLQNRPVIVTRQPGGTELGLQLRRLLLDPRAGEPMQNQAELFLYAADRAQHVEGFLKPQLAAGAIVLCDRYTPSTIAYQGYGRGLSLTLIDQLNQLATGGLESDLTLWLDVDVEIGLARTLRRATADSAPQAADRIERADLAFHRRVQQGYTHLAKANPDRIVPVDAGLNEEAVAQQIQAILNQHLAKWGFGNCE